MQKFVKENLVLVTGIVLPVLLVIGFLILANIPRALLDPPQHDFLLVGYRYDSHHIRNYYLDFEIKDGVAVGRVTPKKENANADYRYHQHANLFLYKTSDQSFEEVAYDLPENPDKLEKPVAFSVQSIRDLSFSSKSISPDGYQFEYLGYRGHGGLLGEIFGMGRRYDSHYVLTKDGVYFELPYPASHRRYYYGQNLAFLGWVVSERK